MADLGCGTGTLTILLAEAGSTVHGLDFSPAMLHRGREKVAGAGITVTLSEGDVANPPLPSGSLDVVLCRHVLWTLPDPGEVLRRWSRLLRPGGCILRIEDAGAPEPAPRPVAPSSCCPTWDLSRALEMLSDAVFWGAPTTDGRHLTSLRFD